MAKERQELIDILNRLELTQKDRLDLEYYILNSKSDSDWNANFDEKGYIKNRTHFFKHCKTINFNKLDCGDDYSNITFVLPKNEGDVHVYYYKENETIFEHILDVGVEIPLKHDVLNNSISLYIYNLDDKGDSIEYYALFIIKDLENIKEEYNIPFYVKKYLLELYIPNTIARKKDISNALLNLKTLNFSINDIVFSYNGSVLVDGPTIYAPTTKGNTGEILVQTENGIPEWKFFEKENVDFSVENAESSYYPTLSLYQTKRILVGSTQEHFIGIPSFSGISLPTNSYVGSLIIYNGQSSETITIVLEALGGDKTFTLKANNYVKVDYVTNSRGSISSYIEGNV